ncbi:MAG: GntR family transcriptional regulator [Lautropia sp.]
MDLNDKIARASLHVEVADRLRDMIFERTLAPGYRIEELDLSAKLGTSRTPLREALKVLANEGLVRLAPGRGAFVTELSPPEVDALFPVLAMIEGRCAAEAVRRLSPADLRRLQAIHQRMEERVAASDTAGYHDATDALHRTLQTIAGNPWLARIATDLRRFLRLARGMVPPSDSRLLQSLAEHRTLMKTIARGDADGADQVMQHHLMAQQKAWRAAQLQAAQAARARAGDGDAGLAQTLSDTSEPIAAPAHTLAVPPRPPLGSGTGNTAATATPAVAANAATGTAAANRAPFIVTPPEPPAGGGGNDAGRHGEPGTADDAGAAGSPRTVSLGA